MTVRAEADLSPATVQRTQARAGMHMALITKAINKRVVINWLAGWLLGSQPTPASPSPSVGGAVSPPQAESWLQSSRKAENNWFIQLALQLVCQNTLVYDMAALC